MRLAPWRRLFGSVAASHSSARTRSRFRPQVEFLENRRVPATLVVSHQADAQYHTIESAVLAAHSGDTIDVKPGTYIEQVVIPAGKDNLTLLSEKPLKAIIQAPPTMSFPEAIVEINGAKNTTLEGFTLTGGTQSRAIDSLEYGVRIDSNGSAIIRDNHITNITDTPITNGDYGVGIEVGADSPSTDFSPGTATIFDNQIDNYQKAGIVVMNAGSSANIYDNTIFGVGPSQVAAQLGVQISGGATGRVEDNYIANNEYAPLTFAGAGIGVSGAGSGVVLDGNTLEHNDAGIEVVDTPNAVVKNNHIAHSNTDGIDIAGTSTGAKVLNNTSENNKQDGIYIGANGNLISGNDVSNNGLNGIELVNAHNNTVQNNEADHNKQDGIHVDAASSGNTIQNNEASHNGRYDFYDPNCGTTNTWRNNKGKTANCPALLSDNGGKGDDDNGNHNDNHGGDND